MVKMKSDAPSGKLVFLRVCELLQDFSRIRRLGQLRKVLIQQQKEIFKKQFHFNQCIPSEENEIDEALYAFSLSKETRGGNESNAWFLLTP